MNPTSPTPETKYPLKNILMVSGFALVIIIALTIGLVLKYSKPQVATTGQSQATTVKSEAQSEYTLAQSARAKGDVTQAKIALTKAKALFAQAKDTSHNKDIDSQLAALNSTSDAKPPQAPAATSAQ